MADLRYIGWEEYGRLAEALANKIISSSLQFELVIGIARGGIPLAMVVADRLGVKLDIVNVKSYIAINKRKTPKIVSTLTEKIEGKTILLVDDLVDNGDTMDTLLSSESQELKEV